MVDLLRSRRASFGRIDYAQILPESGEEGIEMNVDQKWSRRLMLSNLEEDDDSLDSNDNPEIV